MEERPYLSANEIAEILGVDPRTVHRLIKSGELPAHRIGKEYRIARVDFETYMRRTRTTEDKGLVELVAR